jgi:hypothetical protein
VRRLPVLAVVREAYAFTFAHLGAVIALIWLPMALVTVLGFFVEQRIFAALQAAYAAHGAAAAGPVLLLFPAYIILAMLLYAAMMAAVAGLALGTRQPGRIPFHFGMAEWRLFRAWFGLTLFLLVPLVLFMLGASALVPADPSAMTAIQASRLSLLVLLLAGAMIFVGLRFTFLLPGLAAGEGAAERGLLTRAWTLSRGNFWRIFAVVMACVVPVYFCGGVLETIVEIMLSPGRPAPSDFAAMVAHSRETLPLTKGFQFLLAPFIIGLMASASVFSVRELSRTDISA